MKGKNVSESETVLSSVMMPTDANHYGSVHGGTILKLVDEAAFVAATKHACKNVLLASMDQIVFDHPVNIGDLLTIKARLCYVGKTSMEVEVEILTERLKKGTVLNVGSAFLTMVAVNEERKSVSVPRLILKTSGEKLKSKQAFNRRKRRLSK
ncbi:MAG: acyl-CoA thioesterase [Candidatus Omnitrophica bacterium]|nr:acyl-CoA thioesterase [Candidatus Omnitrophota bacterium]MCK5287549.1 acyl-CoA thioesterase [Candidatus Omnitrophota bacterium]MCK5393823.1 acyl-CoA thioesterase [Candidatus Omnitrophota bacterium]